MRDVTRAFRCLHVFAQCLGANSGALHLFKLLIASGAPIDARNNAGLTALDTADNPEIRAALIEAYSAQRSSGQLKFNGSSTFKTPKEITLEIRALAQASSKIAANPCGSCGTGLGVSLPSQGQAGLFDHRCVGGGGWRGKRRRRRRRRRGGRWWWLL